MKAPKQKAQPVVKEKLLSKFGNALTYEIQCTNSKQVISDNPQINEFAYRLTTNQYNNSNQMCIDCLLALKAYIKDFKPSTGRVDNRSFPEYWTTMVNIIQDTNRLHEGSNNAIQQIGDKLKNIV